MLDRGEKRYGGLFRRGRGFVSGKTVEVNAQQSNASKHLMRSSRQASGIASYMYPQREPLIPCLMRLLMYLSYCFGSLSSLVLVRKRANYSVVARCEVHGTAVKPGMKGMKAGEKQYMSAFALNEWDSKLAGGVEWRQKIDTQVCGGVRCNPLWQTVACMMVVVDDATSVQLLLCGQLERVPEHEARVYKAMDLSAYFILFSCFLFRR